MKKVNVSSKYIVFCFMAAVTIDALALALGAILIERGSLAFDAMGVWSLAALVLASWGASFICTSRSGTPMNACTAVLVYFFLLVIFLPMRYGTNISFSVTVKELTALFCGSFVGNFMGMSRHNSLRNFRKKRRTYTK